MLGAFRNGARYNLAGAFGCLYTSLELETARAELSKYFTVLPRGGFLEAVIRVRLNRVLDLTDPRTLRGCAIQPEELTSASYLAAQAVSLRAWQSGVEGLLAPSVAAPGGRNLAVFLDNQTPGWRIELRQLEASELLG